MDNNIQFFIAVKALIVFNGKFLIVRRSNQARDMHGVWELPGGRLEFGESPEYALLREIKEEVGLELTTLKVVNSWTFMKTDRCQIVGLNFLCRPVNNIVRLSHEHSDYVWIGKQDIDTYLPKDIAMDLYDMEINTF